MKARGRTLGFAAALAALVAGLVTWARLGVDRPDEAARSAHARSVNPLSFRPDEVSTLTLARRGAPPVVVERDDAGWRITSPESGPAAAAEVEALLGRLAALRVRASLQADPSGLSSRGLDPPSSRVAVALRDGRVIRLDLGVESPFDHATFARGGGDILVVEGVPPLALDPAPAPLRAAPGGG